ncbi:MAG: serine/threonine protein kinase, partial [Planctomycetales bacterium]|nr:serine/threonine protein kinase [Planctomycetales bacterium]
QLEILDLIGHGGMGAVYKARQLGLDRLVALKILPPSTARDPSFAERFSREARALARLSHPNIVAVYDSGNSGGYFYLLMEYVDGVNLREAIVAKTLTPSQALAVVPQICEALQFAHDEGVVHRDIKPENVLLDQRGRVKVADFGLAKLLRQPADDEYLTHTHQVMGTPRYMAPEQMEGSRAVDHRADIYSLGVVFYEMLTGQIPAGHFDPPSKKVQVDARLDQVVLRSLAREPERRYQRASELKSDVERVSSGGDFVREPSSQPDSHTATTMRDVAPAGTGKTPVPLGTLVVRFLTLVCAGSAVASIFLKWTRVSVAPVVQGTNAIPEAYAFNARGMHYLYPVLAALMALALCFVTVSVFDRVRSRLLAIGALATGLAFCLVALAVAVGEPFPSHAGWSDAGSHLYPQQSYRWTDAASQLIGRWQYWGDVSIHVEPQEGPLVAGLCGCALVFLGFVELRWCVDENARRSAGDPLTMARFVGEPLTLAALAAFAAPVVAVVTWGAYLLATGGDFPGEMGLPTLIIAAIPIHLAHVATCGWVMWMGGRAMRRGSGYGWAIAGSIAAMLPLSFAWVVSLPVGIWALIVLLRADVRQAFRQQAAAELFNAAENSNLIAAEVLAARLRTCGTLLLVGSAIAVVSQVWVPISILAERARRPEDNIPYVVIFMMLGATGIPVVFSAIMAFGGWKLRKLTSFAWGRVAAVLAIVPFSLAAPLLIPVGVWTLVQLHRRVRFPNRSRDDERVGRAASLFLSAKKGEAVHPGSPVGHAAGEVASESDTSKADRGKMQADESLGFVVFGFVVVGGSRCLELFPRVWKIADQLFVDGPQSVESPARLLLQLT